MEKLLERIEYVKQQIAAAGRHDGWVVEGMKSELERLERKLARRTKKK